jgi:hypothetical protein
MKLVSGRSLAKRSFVKDSFTSVYRAGPEEQPPFTEKAENRWLSPQVMRGGTSVAPRAIIEKTKRLVLFDYQRSPVCPFAPIPAWSAGFAATYL